MIDVSETVDPKGILASASVLFNARDVAGALARMASSVEAAIGDRNPVVLAVMNGGVFVAAELCKRFEFPYEFDYVHATRYGRKLSGGELQWKVPPSAELTDRVILVVDDILDRGHTLSALLEAVGAVGPREVFSAVLVQKTLNEKVARPHVDFVGLETGDTYVFGCGMDYAGYWRGLPDLYGTTA